MAEQRIRIIIDVVGDPAEIEAAARASWGKGEPIHGPNGWDAYVGVEEHRLSYGCSEIVADAFSRLDNETGPPWEVMECTAQILGEFKS